MDSKKKKVAELENIIANPNFWNDQKKAKEVLSEKSRLANEINSWETKNKEISELKDFFELAQEEQDVPVLNDILAKLKSLEKGLAALELQTFLNKPEDKKGSIVAINAGAGGTEACDWASMLLRMYLRWAERKGYKVKMMDELPGEGAGYKNVTFEVEGDYAYGYLKAEAGVHRLVRISPFDANKRRHTSFASVYIYPLIDEEIKIEINDKDLRIDTYRAGGPGGQYVNRTDSAVRMTHLPTGIVVQCQNQRSQHQNREEAMKMLRSRLYELELQERKKKETETTGEKKDIGFGSQIRSYVMQPYRIVKDHRTNFEMGNVDAVMDGDLDDFINAYLVKFH